MLGSTNRSYLGQPAIKHDPVSKITNTKRDGGQIKW
jgi:hypothetical protein